MGEKGSKTREYIKEKANKLFAARGFKQVTMKDICEATGLSRGGLYRYFGSTQIIFEEIFADLTRSAKDETEWKMDRGVGARNILREILTGYRKEMDDSERSLSLAMCEYSQVVSDAFFRELNRQGKKRWQRLIQYGVDRGEFEMRDISQITDLILFSYQGVRMWSSIIPVDAGVSRHVTECIWEILTGTEWGEWKPIPVLESERLVLRPLTLRDAEEAYNNWTSDPEVAKYMRWNVHEDVEMTREWLRMEQEGVEAGEVYDWGFVRKDTGELIGSGGLCYSREQGAFELGYNLMKKHWNQGYATEAAKRVVDYAIEELGQKKLYCCHAKDNPASGRVMEKAGFTYWKDSSYTSWDGRKKYECREYILSRC